MTLMMEAFVVGFFDKERERVDNTILTVASFGLHWMSSTDLV